MNRIAVRIAVALVVRGLGFAIPFSFSSAPRAMGATQADAPARVFPISENCEITASRIAFDGQNLVARDAILTLQVADHAVKFRAAHLRYHPLEHSLVVEDLAWIPPTARSDASFLRVETLTAAHGLIDVRTRTVKLTKCVATFAAGDSGSAFPPSRWRTWELQCRDATVVANGAAGGWRFEASKSAATGNGDVVECEGIAGSIDGAGRVVRVELRVAKWARADGTTIVADRIEFQAPPAVVPPLAPR
ncbi:MAG: hypothetical protein ACKVX7_18915 [Planctomycetota bacterium]